MGEGLALALALGVGLTLAAGLALTAGLALGAVMGDTDIFGVDFGVPYTTLP
jgi:hypothetical protein